MMCQIRALVRQMKTNIQNHVILTSHSRYPLYHRVV